MNTYTTLISQKLDLNIIDVKKILLNKKLELIKKNVEEIRLKKGFNAEKYQEEIDREDDEEEVKDEMEIMIEEFELEQEEEGTFEREKLKEIFIDNKRGVFLVNLDLNE